VNGGQAGSVARAIALLDAVAETEGGARMGELARRIGLAGRPGGVIASTPPDRDVRRNRPHGRRAAGAAHSTCRHDAFCTVDRSVSPNVRLASQDVAECTLAAPARASVHLATRSGAPINSTGAQVVEHWGVLDRRRASVTCGRSASPSRWLRTRRPWPSCGEAGAAAASARPRSPETARRRARGGTRDPCQRHRQLVYIGCTNLYTDVGVPAQGADQSTCGRALVRDRFERTPLQVPPAGAGAGGGGLTDRGHRLDGAGARRVGTARPLTVLRRT
jgi:hypothetical protein